MEDSRLISQYSLIAEDIERAKREGPEALVRYQDYGVGRLGNTFNLMIYNIGGNLNNCTTRIHLMGLGRNSD